MLAKIIACGPSRDSARLRLIEALETCVLFGPAHNRDFLVACLNTDSFARGEATTAFIEEEFGADTAGGRITRAVPGFRENAAAAVIELALEHTALMARSVIVSPELRDWASASALVSRKRYAHGDALYDLSVIALRAGEYRVSAGEDAALVSLHSLADSRAQIEIDGLRHTARYCQAGPGLLHVSLAGCSAEFRDLIRLDGLQDTRAGSGNVIAPMHGLLLDVKVAAGDEVTAGQTLAILEAMKMHYEITADVAGTVREVLVAAGTQVAADDRLLDIDIAPAD